MWCGFKLNANLCEFVATVEKIDCNNMSSSPPYTFPDLTCTFHKTQLTDLEDNKEEEPVTSKVSVESDIDEEINQLEKWGTIPYTFPRIEKMDCSFEFVSSKNYPTISHTYYTQKYPLKRSVTFSVDTIFTITSPHYFYFNCNGIFFQGHENENHTEFICAFPNGFPLFALQKKQHALCGKGPIHIVGEKYPPSWVSRQFRPIQFMYKNHLGTYSVFNENHTPQLRPSQIVPIITTRQSASSPESSLDSSVISNSVSCNSVSSNSLLSTNYTSNEELQEDDEEDDEEDEYDTDSFDTFQTTDESSDLDEPEDQEQVQHTVDSSEQTPSNKQIIQDLQEMSLGTYFEMSAENQLLIQQVLALSGACMSPNIPLIEEAEILGKCAEQMKECAARPLVNVQQKLQMINLMEKVTLSSYSRMKEYLKHLE